ncbi:hypothetical protein JW930_03570 [Candidatus Woesearchaeota archaeon]|nr:hypothetical protein [Candidatus Woesearchaeota archaeon]
MVAFVPVAVGSVLGIALGRYSYTKIFNKKEIDVHLDLRFNKRTEFLKNFYDDVHSFVTDVVCYTANSEQQELLDRMEHNYFKFIAYYQPLFKLYFNDTNLRRYSKNMVKQIKGIHKRLPSASLKDIRQRIEIISQNYQHLHDKIMDTEMLLWI